MTLRKSIRQVPGARACYCAVQRMRRRIRRALFGPTQAERYDIETCDVIQRVVDKDSSCIDLGAHNGDVLRMIVNCAPQGQHHAVEPLPHLAKKLAANFPNVMVHASAVSDATGDSAFDFVVDAPAYSGLRRRTYPRADYEVSVISVPVRRLDDLVPPDCVVRLIKADIEGGEYAALVGGREILLRSKPFVIFEFDHSAAEKYGVTPAMFYSLLNGEIGLQISTMRRWLDGQPPLTLDAFARLFESREEFYFLAFPG